MNSPTPSVSAPNASTPAGGKSQRDPASQPIRILRAAVLAAVLIALGAALGFC